MDLFDDLLNKTIHREIKYSEEGSV